MISARIRAELPAETWMKEVSQLMPNATFRLLSGVQAGETAIELGEAVGDDLQAITKALETHESISSFELLEFSEGKALAKYETRDTGLYHLVSVSSLPIEYPVIVEDGWYELDVTGTRDEFEQLRAVLDSKGYSYELLFMVQTREPTEIITERQNGSTHCRATGRVLSGPTQLYCRRTFNRTRPRQIDDKSDIAPWRGTGFTGDTDESAVVKTAFHLRSRFVNGYSH